MKFSTASGFTPTLLVDFLGVLMVCSLIDCKNYAALFAALQQS
jgi:hypothetical protein